MQNLPSNRGVFLNGDGTVVLTEAPPPPAPGRRQALVRVTAAAISVGTETTMIRRLRAAAAPRADAAPIPLGYAVAGHVLSAGPEYDGPPPGSAVACYGGPYVWHADLLTVGQNLIAPVPAGVPDTEAAFSAIAAIALHGVRQAQVELGARVGVLGLGLLGQLGAQLVRASGGWVLACDPLPGRRALAESVGAADRVTDPDGWEDAAREFTAGRGLDAVLVFAGSPDSSGPAVAALRALRFRGRLVIVGNVRTEFEREALFQKEATVLVSRAAGPGRYDPVYEKEGYDLPPGFVPWTEGRNLRCAAELLGAGRLRIAPLLTGVLPAASAPEAYERLLTAPEQTLALALRFQDTE